MQKDEVLAFLERIDDLLKKDDSPNRLQLRIIGKSALLLAGLKDTLGTVDIDLLKVQGRAEKGNPALEKLEKEFSRQRLPVNGYYLEFVSPTFALLSRNAEWLPVGEFSHLRAEILEPHHLIAAKIFSAHADTPRKKDRQDVRAALDQGLVEWERVCAIADDILGEYAMDARSERFPDVCRYLKEELMADYGEVPLRNGLEF